ncbi:hypothetical protein COU61_05145 [Candidatus Pacearchaeota archaeon CG10_big_fil_rev_8_21_14_0_10_35_13]|nr:MAG: hypothetical protein COU61_05145 [Candidatus Pacearchaeota archaeon CG10_big_fil_rev_8_21_14_0_10_35_13]
MGQKRHYETKLEVMTKDGVRNLIMFPVGDWSDDGHGKCEYYFATTQRSLEEVREAHHNAPNTLGFPIEGICQDYGDPIIDNAIVEKLRTEGYGKFEISDEDDGKIYPSGEEVFKIWIFLLNKINPGLELKQTDMPSINYYGKDKSGKRLRTPGYELFQ